MVADTSLTGLERVLLVLVLAASLFLHLASLGTFLTTDEGLWHDRSVEFNKALAARDWASTYQAGHPGVVTMWLGTAAQHLPWLGQPWLWDDAIRRLMNDPAPAPGTGISSLTLGARRLVALVTWLGILVLCPLLRRLFNARVALVTTALVGLDPFLLAHSRLHHLDALLATFVMLSMASLLVYEFRSRRLRYLLLSAAMAALATANKSPGILLVPWAGVVLLLPTLLGPQEKRRQALVQAAKTLAVWGLGATVVFCAIWPSMWMRPLWTLESVFGVARQYAETPHEGSNFFWGAVRPDPGPGFYPVVWAFRSTAPVWLGLVVVAARRAWRRSGVLLLILLLTLLFAAVMTVGEKKFDRYLLPDFPLLDIVAAVGLAAGAEWLAGRLVRAWKAWAVGLLLGGVAVAQFALVWPARPYYLSYYNPIVGGGRTAPQTLLVGWGEGLDQAAAYVNSRPGARNLEVFSWRRPEFGTFFVGQMIDPTRSYCPARPSYYIFYRNNLQREQGTDVWDRLAALEAPEYVVTLNGIDYAWVYANMLYRKAEQKVVDYILARADPAQDIIVVDGKQQLAHTYDGPVPMMELVVGKREDSVRTALQEVAAGRRHLWYFAYPGDECDQSQLRKQLELGAKAVDEVEVDGVRAVCYELGAEAGFVPSPPQVPIGAHLGPVTLVGCDVEPLVPGEGVRVRLYWQTSAPVSQDYTVFVQLFGPEGEMWGQADSMPQGGTLPTSAWKVGLALADDHVVEVPADAPAGGYYLLLGLYDAASMLRVQAVDAAGQRLPDDAVRVSGLQIGAR